MARGFRAKRGLSRRAAWLGADQSLGADPRPAIFGTVALVDGGYELFEDREWWASDEAAAMANHRRLVGRLRD